MNMHISLLRQFIREVVEEPASASAFTPERMNKLKPLASEALKAGSYEDFERNYMIQGKRGIYWHVTEDPNFFIDPNKGPRDMSAGGTGSGLGMIGDLMITSDLLNWTRHYGKTRQYAALIDMSDVDTGTYRTSRRGFGNEFYIRDAANSRATVKQVVPIGTAKKIDKDYSDALPKSYGELKEFYNLITGLHDTTLPRHGQGLHSHCQVFITTIFGDDHPQCSEK